MIRNLKVDRFMVLIMQCRVNQIKHNIKSEFDVLFQFGLLLHTHFQPAENSISTLLQGNSFRPGGASLVKESKPTTNSSSSSSGRNRKRVAPHGMAASISPPHKSDINVRRLDN